MRAIVAGILALLLLGAAPSAGETPTSTGARWAADWNAKKLEAVMAHYAIHPAFLAGNGERWEGADTMRTHFAALLAQFSADMHLHSIKSETSGDLAYDSGTYDENLTTVKTGAVMHSTGTYLFVFRREKGSWKILEQTFIQYVPLKP